MIRVLDLLRIGHDRVVVAAEISGEHDAIVPPIELNGRSSKNVPGATQQCEGSAGQLLCLIEWNGFKLSQRAGRIVLRVERQCGLVLRESVPVGVFGVLLEQVSGIGQQYLAEG